MCGHAHGVPGAALVTLLLVYLARTSLAAGLDELQPRNPGNGYPQPEQQHEGWLQQLQRLQEQQAQSALLKLFQETNGVGWEVFRAQNNGSLHIVPWNAGTPVCSWTGVACCESSPLTFAPCNGSSSVVMLDLKGFGLSGQLPLEISGLPHLQVLNLEDNPRLRGPLPDSLQELHQLLWLSIRNTSLTGCAGSPQARGKPITDCALPSALEWAPPGSEPAVFSSSDEGQLRCPNALLRSFRAYTQGMDPTMKDKLTNPLPQPPVPGAIFASPSFSLFFGCHCADGGAPPTLTDSGISGSWKCPSGGSEDSEGGGGGGGDDTGLVAAVVVVVVVLALLLLGISGYLLRNVQPGAQSRSQQQAELSRKRSKVPGTPGVALQAGQGLVVSGDVLVTWVCTDVADSTWLWEWDAEVMDQAIAMHNTTIRELLEEQGGHEIRNEGDSFVMSFHDASDAVRFCLQVQERLLQLPWPPKLLSIPQAACVTMGDVSDNPSSKGQGPLIIAGLRVRIGINTGVPDDVFLHNVTEHVDYRGNEYDLAGQICDIADGGQILMGPKTYQRWNKCCTDTPDETNHHQASFEGPMSAEDTRFQRTSIMGRFASQTGRRQSMLAMKSIQSRNPRLGSTSERLMRVREMNGASPTASGIDLPMDPQSRTNASSARRSHSGTEVFPDGCRFPQDLPAGSPPMSLQASRIAPSSTLPGPISESFISPVREFWNRAASLPPDGTSSLALPPLNLHQQQCVDPQGQQQQPHVHPQLQQQQQQQRQQQQPYFHSLHVRPEQQPRRQQLQPCVHSLHVQHQQQPQQQRSHHKGLQQQQQQQQQHPLHVVPQQQQQPCVHPLPMPQQQQIQVCGCGPGPLCESLTRTSPGPAHSNQAPDTTVQGAGGCASASAAAGAAADGTEAGAAVAAASEPQEASLVHPAAAALGNVCTEMHDAPVHGCAIDGQRNPALMRLFEAPSNRMPSSTQQGSPMAPDSTSFKQWDMLQHMGSSEHLHHSSFSGVKMEEDEDGGGIIHYIDAPKRLEMDKAHLNMVTADADPERSSVSNRLREMTSMVSWTWKGTKQKVHRLFTHARMQREAAAMFFGADDEGGEGQAGRGLWGNTLQAHTPTQASQGIIIDMGYYEWRYMGSTLSFGRQPSSRNPDMQERGSFIHLVQVVSNVVAPRVLLFRWPLAITAQWEKLAPGFFDAPGASNLSFPNMLDPGITGEFRKSRPKVVIAFASLEGYSQICATDLEVAQDVLSSYNACVRETLAICEGYECKEINGSFMAAFADGCKAMEWALTLHLALAAAAIAEEVLDRCKLPNYLWQAVAQQLTKGVHARVGIYGGTIDRVTPNHKTGRADYFGQPVNRAARLMSAASGGQTLCEQRFMSDVLSEWANRSEPKVESDKTAGPAAEASTRQQGTLDEEAFSSLAQAAQQQRTKQEEEKEVQPPQQHTQQGLQQVRQQQGVPAAEAQQQQQQQQQQEPSHKPLVSPDTSHRSQPGVSAGPPSSSPFHATPSSPPVRPNLQSLSMQAAPWRAQGPTRLVMHRKPWDPEQQQQQQQQQQQEGVARASGSHTNSSHRPTHAERPPSCLRRGSMTASQMHAQQRQESHPSQRSFPANHEQGANRLSHAPKRQASLLRRASMAAFPALAQQQQAQQEQPQQTPATQEQRQQVQFQSMASARRGSAHVPLQRCNSLLDEDEDEEPGFAHRVPAAHPELLNTEQQQQQQQQQKRQEQQQHHHQPPATYPRSTSQFIGPTSTPSVPEPPSASEPLPLHPLQPIPLHTPQPQTCLRQQACLEIGEHIGSEAEAGLPLTSRGDKGGYKVSPGNGVSCVAGSESAQVSPSSPFAQHQVQDPAPDSHAILQRQHTSFELTSRLSSHGRNSPPFHPLPYTPATTTYMSDADSDLHPPRTSADLTSRGASSLCQSTGPSRHRLASPVAAHMTEVEADSLHQRDGSRCRACSVPGHSSAPQHTNHCLDTADMECVLGAGDNQASDVDDRLSGGRLGGPDPATQRRANGEGSTRGAGQRSSRSVMRRPSLEGEGSTRWAGQRNSRSRSVMSRPSLDAEGSVRGPGLRNSRSRSVMGRPSLDAEGSTRGAGQRNSRSRSAMGRPSLDRSHRSRAQLSDHGGGLSPQGSLERAKSWMKLDRPSRAVAPAGEHLMTRISRASRKPKKQSSIRAEHQSREPSVHRRRDSEGEVEPSSREGPKLNAEVFEIKCTDGANEDITMFKYRNELGSLSQGAARLQGHNSQQLPVVSVPMPTDVAKVPVDVSAVALGVYRLKGVTELVHVVRVMPASLERPATQHRSQLEGKATCVSYNPTKLGNATIWLPEVRQLNCCASAVLPSSLNVNATSLLSDALPSMRGPPAVPEGESGLAPDPGFWSPTGQRRSLPFESVGGGELLPGPLTMDRLGSSSKAWDFCRYSLPVRQATTPPFFPSATTPQMQAISSTTNPLYSGTTLSRVASLAHGSQEAPVSCAHSLDQRHTSDSDAAAAAVQASGSHLEGVIRGAEVVPAQGGSENAPVVVLGTPPAMHASLLLHKHPPTVSMHMPLSSPAVLDSHTPPSSAQHALPSAPHTVHSSSPMGSLATSAAATAERGGMWEVSAASHLRTSELMHSAFQGFDVESGPLQPISEDRS